MNDPVRVGVTESLHHLHSNVEHLGLRERATLDSLGERHSGHELHHDEVGSLLGIVFEDRGDVRMAELGQSPRLTPEAPAGRIVFEPSTGKDLDRHGSADMLVAREVHDPHAAHAQLLHDLIVRELLPDQRLRTEPHLEGPAVLEVLFPPPVAALQEDVAKTSGGGVDQRRQGERRHRWRVDRPAREEEEVETRDHRERETGHECRRRHGPRGERPSEEHGQDR